MLWLIAEWKWLERRKGLRLSNAVNTPGRWSNVCSKSQIVSAKLKRKKKKTGQSKEMHLLGGPSSRISPLKLTCLQICSRMSTPRLWEISNALNIKTALSIISRGTCHLELSRFRPKNTLLHTQSERIIVSPRQGCDSKLSFLVVTSQRGFSVFSLDDIKSCLVGKKNVWAQFQSTRSSRRREDIGNR